MTSRRFPDRIKVAAFERAAGRCEVCTAWLGPGNIEYDHIVPYALGGKSTLDNCRCLCKTCHKSKTAGKDAPRVAKSKRQRKKHIGAKTRKGPPMPGSRASGIRKRMDGTVERW